MYIFDIYVELRREGRNRVKKTNDACKKNYKTIKKNRAQKCCTDKEQKQKTVCSFFTLCFSSCLVDDGWCWVMGERKGWGCGVLV
jgi:hypothetical protein